MDDRLDKTWQSPVRPADVKATYHIFLARQPDFDPSAYEESDENLGNFIKNTCASQEFKNSVDDIFQNRRLPHSTNLAFDELAKACSWLSDRFGIFIRRNEIDWNSLISVFLKKIPNSILESKYSQKILSSIDGTFHSLGENRSFLSTEIVAPQKEFYQYGINFDADWYLNEYPDVAALNVNPFDHYMYFGRHERRCPAFDEKWYTDIYQEVGRSELAPRDHYEKIGKNKGFRPFFDAIWYIEEYTDIAATRIEPFLHYKMHGRHQGRHPCFDPIFYSEEYPDVSSSGLSPYAHYVLIGRFQARHPALDPFWYADEYADAEDSNWNSVAHYREIGRKNCYHPAFNRSFYLSEHPAIAAMNREPLEHYRTIGKDQGLHPSFNHHWYLSEYSDINNINDAYYHYVSIGKRQGRHPAFNRSWYLREYLERNKIEQEPYEYYTQQGRDEVKYPAFDSFWYVNSYLHNASSHLSPMDHFRNIGKQKNYQPAFARSWYLSENHDVAQLGIDPLSHYIDTGRAQGRRIHPSQPDTFMQRYTRKDSYPEAVDCKYEDRQDFSSHETKIKAIAFYLPQYHEVEENNVWWGKGFTEWTNTKKATPKFRNHYQPREPHEDIGYYDLSNKESIKSQVKLAQEHGIYGFCFYYYWFSRKRLLEKPLDIILNDRSINMPFCLCWANENWTRAWDGMEKDVLIEQKYAIDDPVAFIDDIYKYIRDDRYIRSDDRPILIVYKPQLIPNLSQVVSKWRQRLKEISGEDLLVWACRTDLSDPSSSKLAGCIDGVVEFPPHLLQYEFSSSALGVETGTGHLFDYQYYVDRILNNSEPIVKPILPYYRGVMLNWDNSPRRDEHWSVWYGFSQKAYYEWLSIIIKYTKEHHNDDEQFIFINAWNEWGEGTYLEPDRKYGYANINITSRAIFELPFETSISQSEDKKSE